MRIAKHIRKYSRYTPGEQPKSLRVIKLNTNENAYPPSPKCADILKNFNLEKLRRYPDPTFNSLREALAKLNQTTIDRIFVGNGSDEVLALAAKCFVENDESIASLDPSYSLYKSLSAIRNVPWEGVDAVKLIKGIKEGTPWRTKGKVSLFLWTNPNAPTGEFVEPSTIATFAKKFPGIVMIDEAYADFSRTNAMTLATAPRNRNILVMRTFSKSYSLAGLRVGYCVGPKELIDALYKTKDSYNVDAIAQAVALAAVKDQAWFERNVTKIKKTRANFTNALISRGWDVIPSESNFVFARPPKGDASRIFSALRERNIFVRYFRGPKTGDRLRVTIGTNAQMKTLLKALDELDFQKRLPTN